jgi:hypothetical protein
VQTSNVYGKLSTFVTTLVWRETNPPSVDGLHWFKWCHLPFSQTSMPVGLFVFWICPSYLFIYVAFLKLTSIAGSRERAGRRQFGSLPQDALLHFWTTCASFFYPRICACVPGVKFCHRWLKQNCKMWLYSDLKLRLEEKCKTILQTELRTRPTGSILPFHSLWNDTSTPKRDWDRL